MASVRCPHSDCKQLLYSLPSYYEDTLQCQGCGKVLYVVIRNDQAVNVRTREIDLEVPPGLPPELQSILSQAVLCYEAGSAAAAVVLAGLFLEGLLKQVGISGDRLVEMIEEAHKSGVVSTLGFHVATASRLIRNIGAHYSAELADLKLSDARLVLEMTRKLASDIAESGRLSTAAGP